MMVKKEISSDLEEDLGKTGRVSSTSIRRILSKN